LLTFAEADCESEENATQTFEGDLIFCASLQWVIRHCGVVEKYHCRYFVFCILPVWESFISAV